MGLIENYHKTVAFAPNYRHRMAFLRFEFSATQIRSQFRVLGVDVLASSETLGDTHGARLAQGHAAAVRLTRAPVDVKSERISLAYSDHTTNHMGMVAQ